MKTFLRILLGLAVVLVLLGVIVYADGASLPVNHVTTVSGVVAASPAKTFAIVCNVAAGPSWRHEVQSVTMLPPEDGHDHWVEHLGHNTDMNFHAVRTDPVDAAGHGRRDVLLKDPQYGGTWTYEVAPASTPGQTMLTITETGYIYPPVYRFMMVHLFGLQQNLNQYLKEIQARATGV